MGAASRHGTLSSARWQPGQALFAGFEGTSCPEPVLELIAGGRLGGVVLFARNVASPRQVRDLVATLRAHEPPPAPLVIAIDQEGGRVQRLRAPWTEWPPMRRLGALDERDDAHPRRGAAGRDAAAAVARALAIELRDCGITLDFAPVVDVDSNPANPVIGDRSFGRDPARVAALASAFISAMQGSGVACCAKHFPGHGDTTLDSHLALPKKYAHDLERLLAVELPPFAAVAAGVASVMSAHAVPEGCVAGQRYVPQLLGRYGPVARRGGSERTRRAAGDRRPGTRVSQYHQPRCRDRRWSRHGVSRGSRHQRHRVRAVSSHRAARGRRTAVSAVRGAARRRRVPSQSRRRAIHGAIPSAEGTGAARRGGARHRGGDGAQRRAAGPTAAPGPGPDARSCSAPG